MPFINFNAENDTMVDAFNLQTVDVIANFTKDGRFRPEFIRYTVYDQSKVSVKIDAIRSVKEYNGYTVFCCLYTNYGRQCEVLLTYHDKDHVWTMEA